MVTTDEGVPCNFWKKDDIGEEGEWRGVMKGRTKGLSPRYGGSKFATCLTREAQKLRNLNVNFHVQLRNLSNLDLFSTWGGINSKSASTTISRQHHLIVQHY